MISTARIWETLKIQHTPQDLLIASDALADEGQELQAACLQWCSRHGKFPRSEYQEYPIWYAHGETSEGRLRLPEGIFKQLTNHLTPSHWYRKEFCKRYVNLEESLTSLGNVLKHFNLFQAPPCPTCKGRGANWFPNLNRTGTCWDSCQDCHALGYIP